MSNPKIIKTEGAEETAEILAASIVEISNGFQKLCKEGSIKEETIVVLLHDYIGGRKIKKTEIRAVLDALPKLKGYYLRKKHAITI